MEMIDLPANDNYYYVKSLASAALALLMPYIPTANQFEASLKIYGMVGAAVLVTINIYKALKRK